MNERTLTTTAVAFLVVGLLVVAGVYYWMHKSPATPLQTNTQPQQQTSNTTNVTNNTSVALAPKNKEDVRAAFRKSLQPGDTTKLGDTSISGEYALQEWTKDPMGGEALLKYDSLSRQWSVVTNTGGSFGVAELHDLGIPQRTVLGLHAALRAQ